MDSAGTLIDELDPGYRVDGSCWQFDPVYSNRTWYQLLENKDGIFRHSSVRLNVQLAIIFIITSSIHLILKRFHLPRLISEFLAGIILGPTVLGRYFPKMSDVLFPQESAKMLSNLMKFGYLFFMFLTGVKMDASLVTKSGSKAWVIGCITIIIPLLLIVSLAKHIGIHLDHYEEEHVEWISMFSGTLMLTSFPVVACLLMHLKIINSELGHLALSTALICDLMSVIIVKTDNYSRLMVQVSPRVGLKSMILSIAVVMIILTVLRPILYWIIRRTPEGKPVKNTYIFSIVIAVMVVAIIGDSVGLQYLYGPFIFGLTVPTGPPLASTLVEKLDTIITGLMLPLMSTYCGFRSNLWELQDLPPLFMSFVVSCGFTVKFLTSFIPAICCSVPKKDAAILGLILSAHGIIELGVFATNADKQSIGTEEFTTAISIVVIMAAAIPVVISNLYDPSKTYTGYQMRNVLHSTEREGLRILVCTHNKDDALAAMKLLDISNPTENSPLSVCGLYLEELVGGSTPLLLNHQLGQKVSSFGGTRWQPIINVFTRFKSLHLRSSHVHIFTAISPPKLMHEYICWVAFDKSVSLIILPFHKKWNARGNTILNSRALRILNRNVIEKAPCSVGILIDRSRIRSKFPILATSLVYRVAVLYMGGKDDLEALSYARRIAKCSSVHLTIIKLTAVTSHGLKMWENLLHEEYMKDMQRSSMHCNVMCKEEPLRDGSETISLIGLIAKEYDLILVGRRHEIDSSLTSGLSEFCELPELGFVGDLLASSDINNPVSVLVVQQQIINSE